MGFFRERKHPRSRATSRDIYPVPLLLGRSTGASRLSRAVPRVVVWAVERQGYTSEACREENNAACRRRSDPSPQPNRRVDGCARTRLTVFWQAVFPLLPLHLLAPAFHAISLCLEKLQEPVAVPVAHRPLHGLQRVFGDRVNPGVRRGQNRGVKIRVKVIVGCTRMVMVS